MEHLAMLENVRKGRQDTEKGKGRTARDGATWVMLVKPRENMNNIIKVGVTTVGIGTMAIGAM